MKTLRSWGLDIDEAFFMAGAPKGPLLDKIKPHLFFDDQVNQTLLLFYLFPFVFFSYLPKDFTNL